MESVSLYDFCISFNSTRVLRKGSVVARVYRRFAVVDIPSVDASRVSLRRFGI